MYRVLVATQLADEGPGPAPHGHAGQHQRRQGGWQRGPARRLVCRPDGNMPLVFDFVDGGAAYTRQWQARRTAYRKAYGEVALPVKKPIRCATRWPSARSRAGRPDVLRATPGRECPCSGSNEPVKHTGTREEVILGLMRGWWDIDHDGMMRMHAQGAKEPDRCGDPGSQDRPEQKARGAGLAVHAREGPKPHGPARATRTTAGCEPDFKVWRDEGLAEDGVGRWGSRRVYSTVEVGDPDTTPLA